MIKILMMTMILKVFCREWTLLFQDQEGYNGLGNSLVPSSVLVSLE
jgi:hypothetical protein